MPMAFEKLFGVKDPYTEWATETVHSPYFRDWDDPMESLLHPSIICQRIVPLLPQHLE